MQTLPAPDIRTNIATWAVPNQSLPVVAFQLLNSLQPESFDPLFEGQSIETTYLDTAGFSLRRARIEKSKYLTLRVRCYNPSDTYAFSAKTENQKFRIQIDSDTARSLLGSTSAYGIVLYLLPGDLQARLFDLLNMGNPNSDKGSLQPVVAVKFKRYAVENKEDRFTLDIGITTDTGKCFPSNVLEFKSTKPQNITPLTVPLRPLKLSKFLWATSP